MRRFTLVVIGVVLVAAPAAAQQGKVLQEQLGPTGEGHTVMRVWGSHNAMGYAQGFMLADAILKMLAETKALVGTSLWSQGRLLMPLTQWKPAELDQEIAGLVAGVKAARPAAVLDEIDVKLVNTYGDWSYACRSHSTWGSFVQGSTKTLSTRRLDFGTPFSTIKHHLLLARQPGDGSVRWVNLAWPGSVVAVTAVNEHGTLASLHDYQSQAVAGAFMPRSVLARWTLTLVKDLPLDQHLDAVWAELQKTPVVTGTFFNYYVPEGHGGVITCAGGAVCSKKRVPQADYFNGEVLITTNSETDGHSVPEGGEFMDTYYKAGKPKTLADHYGLMGHTGLHLMSVDYRARGDMTIWAEGRLTLGVTPTLKVEFAQLYEGPTPATDGAVTRDGAVRSDGPQGTDQGGAAADTGSQPPAKSDGCGCTVGAPPGAPILLVLVGLVLLVAACSRRR